MVKRKISIGEKPYLCDFEGCNYKCSRSGNLIKHKRIHTSEKTYICDFIGCDFTCNRSDSLARHKITHTGQKLHLCDFHECDYASSTSYALVVHKRKHTGEKNYSCDFPDCEYICANSSNLAIHRKIHTGEKLHICDFPGCDYKSTGSGALVVHKRGHYGEKPFECNFEGCVYKSSNSSHLVRHKRTHTLEGQIRRKKQENRVNNLLKEWGYTVDCETTINASRNKCLTDTQRNFSRIDFRIVECVNMILFLEVDEDQHYWYELSCEFSRMSDIRASLVKSGYTLPIYWIRYNPNGKYHIGEDQIKIRRPEREMELKNHLEKICSDDFKPENQVNIHYMFYDLNSETSGPSIKFDSDFPDAMKNIISWNTLNIKK